jgi:glycosyltransferase involved in cell wall biosynthesis
LRLAVYCDFPYRRHQDRTYAGQAFVLFLLGLGGFVDRLILVGRLEPEPTPWHFPLPDYAEYEPLPHYADLSRLPAVLRAAARSARRFWRVLDDVDTVWLFGPNPLAVMFALLAMARSRQVALGVRQDYLAYVRSRHPGRWPVYVGAVLLDRAFRLLARRCDVIAVGPVIAAQYSGARRCLQTSMVLVSERDLLDDRQTAAAARDGGLAVLNVGRLDDEKNPLLLADILAGLREDGQDWHMVVCGDGPLEGKLAERMATLGVADHAELRGFVPAGEALNELYRRSDFFLHVSFTEGVPQVLFEAFAAGLPVVATRVGGVVACAGAAALLVQANDARAAVGALRRLAGDDQLRTRMVVAGLQIAREHTREAQCRAVVEFLGGKRRC